MTLAAIHEYYGNLPIRADKFAALPTIATDRTDPWLMLKVKTPTVCVWVREDRRKREIRYERLRDGAWSRCVRDDLTADEWSDVILFVRLGAAPERFPNGVVVRVR